MKKVIFDTFRWAVLIPASATGIALSAFILTKMPILPDWVSMSILGAAFVVPAQLIAPSRKHITGTVAAWIALAAAVGLIFYRVINGPDLNFFGWVFYLWGILLFSIAAFLFRFSDADLNPPRDPKPEEQEQSQR